MDWIQEFKNMLQETVTFRFVGASENPATNSGNNTKVFLQLQ